MKRVDLLKQMSFGSQIAEDEVNALASYFVETNQWRKIANGEIDIIRGEKGAGKSAIYALLTTRVDDFFDRGILLVAAENPRGATVFKDLVADPPTTEQEFIVLWKLYVLAIIARQMRDYDMPNTPISDHSFQNWKSKKLSKHRTASRTCGACQRIRLLPRRRSWSISDFS
jgi:hypothetical protein